VTDAVTDAADGPYCDRCGKPVDTGTHVGCRRDRELEPPRFCRVCRRRMKVQVLPRGWIAGCVEHGEVRSTGESTLWGL
jgi:hypothetical protein